MGNITDALAKPRSIYQSVGGVDTYLYMTIRYTETQTNKETLEKQNTDKYLYIWLGSIISISYSVYRNKKAVHNIGHKTISGFAKGPRYVAGTIVKAMFLEDDMMEGLLYLKNVLRKQGQFADELAILNMTATPSEMSNLMLDDILSCDINILYMSEYGSKGSEPLMIKETIIGATFINNGQVMSVNDLITETTMSYIAKDILQYDKVNTPITPVESMNTGIIRASDLI